MIFSNSLAAWLLFLVPILGLIYYFRFKDRLKLWQFFQHQSRWNQTIQLSDQGFFFWKKAIALIVLLLMIIAFMRPQFGERIETVERNGRQIYFIIDTSLSMLAKDQSTTRLEVAKYHINQLLPKLQNDIMGIIPYSSTAYTYLPLTSDLSAITLFLDDVFVGMIGSAGSNIMNALQVVSNSIKKQGNNASTLIIFTDGEFSNGLDQTKIDGFFNNQPIDTVVVGLGSTQGDPIPLNIDGTINYKKDDAGNIVISKRNDTNLSRLAEVTNGKVFDGNLSPIVAEKIYVYLSNLETQLLQQKQKVTKIDRYHWVLMIVLFLLLLEYIYPRLYLTYFSKTQWLVFFLLSTNLMAAHPGNKAYNNQDYQKAKMAYSDALKKQPDNAKLNYNLGNVFYKEKDYANAITAYSEAVEKLSPRQQTNALYNIGTSYLQQKQLDKALAAYKEVLKRDPNHKKTRENIEIALRQQQTTAVIFWKSR